MPASDTLRVAGYQMPVTSDPESNTSRILNAVQKAADEGAEILLTPEGSLSGYTPSFDPAAASKALGRVTEAARLAQVGLALGTCFVGADGRCYNQVRFYRPDGAYLGFHSKTLLCGSLADPPQGEINHYATSDLRVFGWREGLTIGGLICNDLWANPGCTPMPDSHLTQRLAELGAQVIFHAVSGGRDGSAWSEVNWRFHESNLLMRAKAGKLWIVTVDNCAPTHIPCSAPSGVVGPDGTWHCRVESQGEGFFVHTLELRG